MKILLLYYQPISYVKNVYSGSTGATKPPFRSSFVVWENEYRVILKAKICIQLLDRTPYSSGDGNVGGTKISI